MAVIRPATVGKQMRWPPSGDWLLRNYMLTKLLIRNVPLFIAAVAGIFVAKGFNIVISLAAFALAAFVLSDVIHREGKG